jgi:hypothetical protein
MLMKKWDFATTIRDTPWGLPPKAGPAADEEAFAGLPLSPRAFSLGSSSARSCSQQQCVGILICLERRLKAEPAASEADLVHAQMARKISAASLSTPIPKPKIAFCLLRARHKLLV